MAMARPVIASNVGALPEVVLALPNVLESARTGWLAEPDDPVSFAQALAAALAVEALAYGAIGTRARRLANQFFTPARAAAAVLDVYANLFEGRG
jgi:glycosyltransferase involved in cell wall biosynthesis